MRIRDNSPQGRRNAKEMKGLALISAAVLGFAGLFYGAAKIDEANGISVSQSLENNGIGGGAAIARYFEGVPAEAPAVPVRLIGMCGGRMLAAMEESAFPANCDWIAPLGGTESESPAAELTGRLVAGMEKRGLEFERNGAAAYTLKESAR